jgi:hypothetical protein
MLIFIIFIRMYDKLVNCPIFSGLSEEELEAIFSKAHHFTKTFEVGDIAAFIGEPVNFPIIVLEGSVKGEMVDFSGKIISVDRKMVGILDRKRLQEVGGGM